MLSYTHIKDFCGYEKPQQIWFKYIFLALGDEIPELDTLLQKTENPEIVFKDYNWDANTNK